MRTTRALFHSLTHSPLNAFHDQQRIDFWSILLARMPNIFYASPSYIVFFPSLSHSFFHHFLLLLLFCWYVWSLSVVFISVLMLEVEERKNQHKNTHTRKRIQTLHAIYVYSIHISMKAINLFAARVVFFLSSCICFPNRNAPYSHRIVIYHCFFLSFARVEFQNCYRGRKKNSFQN